MALLRFALFIAVRQNVKNISCKTTPIFKKSQCNENNKIKHKDRSNERTYALLPGPPLAQPKCSVTVSSLPFALGEGEFVLGKVAEAHAWLTLAPLALQMVPSDAAMLPVQAVVPRGLHPVPQ